MNCTVYKLENNVKEEGRLLTFNGGKASDYALNVVSIGRDFLPPVKNNYLDIDGRNGSYFAGSTLDKKVITVPVNIVATSDLDLRNKARAIGGWLYTTEEVAFSFDDEPNLVYTGKVEEASLEEVLRFGSGTLKFVCGKPTADGLAKSVTVTSGTAFTVGGTAPAFPTFTVSFTASATEWKVTNADGKYIRVVDNFVAGDTLVIDCSTGKITINGTVSMPTLDIQSRFFSLKVGSNTLTITPTAVSTCTADYKEQWY